MTRGEARRFTRLVEDAVRPAQSGLPPVAQTDALAAFDAWLGAAPRANALGLRALLRLGALAGRQADDLLRRIALHCYYGDARVMAALGYDADAIVARARAAAGEGRGTPGRETAR